MKNKLIVFLLALLGFSSCDNRQVEYGAPYDTFTIKGKVTDTAGNPIKDIVVSLAEWTHTSTDGQGLYSLNSQNYWAVEELTFTDKDGPENGGEFIEKTIEVKITRDDQVEEGDGNWYVGHFLKTVDTSLEKKE